MTDVAAPLSFEAYKALDSSSFPLTVTEAARSKIAELAYADEQRRLLRVEVASGGCSGKQYVFNMVGLETIVRDDDIVLFDGMPLVVVDKLSLEHIKGAVVDYITTLQWTGFIISDNPQSSSSCNCGSSFT